MNIPSSQTRRIYGKALNNNGAPITVGKVVIYTQKYQGKSKLGESKLGADGGYSVTFSDDGSTGGCIVNLLGVNDEPLWDSGLTPLTGVQQELNITFHCTGNEWITKGTVFDQTGKPVNGGFVQAFCYTDGQQVFLGESLIDAVGHYVITYGPDVFKGGVQKPCVFNVKFKVLWPTRCLRMQTELYPCSAREQIIDITLCCEPETCAHEYWHVHGAVTVSTGGVYASGLVRVIDKHENQEYPLGEAVLNMTGQYDISFCRERFQHGDFSRVAPDIVVRVYTSQQVLLAESVLYSQAAPDLTVDLVVPAIQAVARAVFGTVVDTAGNPMAGLTVKALHVQIGGSGFTETLLGSATVGSDGSYKITYTPGSAPGSIPVNLVVRVFASGSTTPVASSAMFANAPALQEANFTISTPGAISLSTYERLYAKLDPLIGTFILAQLTELMGSNEKLQHLAGITGEELSLVRGYAAAHQIFADVKNRLDAIKQSGLLVKIKPSIFFAITWNTLTLNLDTLLGVSGDQFTAALAGGLVDNVIPQTIKTDLVTINSEWRTISIALIAAGKSTGESVTLMQQLALIAGLDAAKTKTVVEVYLSYPDDNAMFWSKLYEKVVQKVLSASDYGKMQLSFDLYNLCHYIPVTKQLYGSINSANPDDIKKLSTISQNALRSLVVTAFKDVTSLPDEIPGATKDEQIDNYTASLYADVQAALPMDFFKVAIAKEPPSSTWAGVAKFLQSNPAVDLATANIAVVAAGQSAALQQQLQTTQRLYKITPDFPTLKKMADAGITSSFQAARMPYEEFVAKYWYALGDETARAIHRKSVEISSKALLMYAALTQEFRPGTLPPVPSAAQPQPLSAAQDNVPSWSALFGSNNSCACPDCQSVFSQSAYFVELLNFLGANTAPLFERRPDLEKMELSCRNANALLPYIDLVNEILENAVCSRTFFIPPATDFLNILRNNAAIAPERQNIAWTDSIINPLKSRGYPLSAAYKVQSVNSNDTWVIAGETWRYEVTLIDNNKTCRIMPSPQTSGDDIDKMVAPEHIHQAAYDILKTPTFPMVLPFDLWEEQIRALFSLKNTSKEEFLSALIPPPLNPLNSLKDDVRVAASFLGFSKAELDIVINTPNRSPWELYGFTGGSNDWLAKLSSVPTFLKKTVLTYDELLDLLDTRIINAQKLISITPESACDIDTMKITFDKSVNDAAQSAVYGTIHRFIRLYKKLGLPMPVLDKILMAAFKGSLPGTPADVALLYQILKLSKQCPLSPVALLSWWYSLDNIRRERSGPSLFEEVFVSQIRDENQAGLWRGLINKDTINPTEKFKQTDTIILLAGLGITETDLGIIISKEFNTQNPITSVSFTLESLTKMYRVVSSAKVMGISIDEYYILKNFIPDTSPLSPLLSFDRLNAMDAVRRRGLTLKEIDYLLRHAGAPQINWHPDTGRISDLLLGMREEADKILSPNPDDPGAVRSFIIRELAKANDLPEQTVESLITKILKAHGPGVKTIDDWQNSMAGGWLLESFKGDGSSLGRKIVSSVHVAEDDTVVSDHLPSDAKTAQWTARLFVKESGSYFFTAKTDSPAVVELKINGSPVTGASAQPLDKGKVYQVAVVWNAKTAATQNVSLEWRKNGEPLTANTFVDPTSTIPFIDSAYILLAKVCKLVKVLNFDADAVEYTNAHVKDLGLVDWNALPVSAAQQGASWLTLAKLLKLADIADMLPIVQNYIPDTQPLQQWSLYKLMSKAELVNFTGMAAEVTGWKKTDIEDLVAYAKSKDATVTMGYADPATWGFLIGAQGMIQRLGVSVGIAINDLVYVEATFEKADKFRQALKAQFSNEQWKEVYTPIGNRLRDLQRNALTEYLKSPWNNSVLALNTSIAEVKELQIKLAYAFSKQTAPLSGVYDSATDTVLKTYLGYTGLYQPDPTKTDDRWIKLWNSIGGRRDAVDDNALFANFLIDVEMQPCMKTTRIVQAVSSVQSFIQRALMNMESGVTIKDDARLHWKWMENYRVWEANRKIFLYPENWIEPELRDDKTGIYKEIEKNLLQKEITEENVEEALVNYLENLSDIGRLHVVGSTLEDATSAHGPVLHVIARTLHSPYVYYYRKRTQNKKSKGGMWSPWEKVDLDITGESPTPVMFHKRLYVFWPSVELKEDKANKKIAEIRFSWSIYQHGAWSAKRTTTSYFIPLGLDGSQAAGSDKEWDVPELYANLHYQVINENTEYVRIRYRINDSYQLNKATGNFLINSDGLDLIKKDVVSGLSQDIYSALVPYGMSLKSNGAYWNVPESRRETDTGVYSYVYASPSTRILSKIKWPIWVYSNNFGFENNNNPLFYEDGQRNYFIMPEVDYARREVDSVGSSKPEDAPVVRRVHYPFETFYHPLTTVFLKRLNRDGIDRLFTRETQALPRILTSCVSDPSYPYIEDPLDVLADANRLVDYSPLYLGYSLVGDENAWRFGQNLFEQRYLPGVDTVVKPYPLSIVDFRLGSAYGVYNWELFFHVPFTIAMRLSNEQRYEEALKWFHYIFNPMGKMSSDENGIYWSWTLPSGAPYWNFLPFFANLRAKDSMAQLLGYDSSNTSGSPLVKDMQTILNAEFNQLIEAWQDDPFKPHLIARFRISAYQKAVVMKYLDNLINWADSLFRQDTMESVNRATHLYILASEILGERPVILPARHNERGYSYVQLKNLPQVMPSQTGFGFDQFGNKLIMLENYLPVSEKKQEKERDQSQGPKSGVSPESPRTVTELINMGAATLYFCIPQNSKLLSYWDTVNDRLFKIRHCMNIEGIQRELALVAPPIEPGLLVRAAAAGVDISSALRDALAPLPYYRFTVMLQKAYELVSDVKALGAAILSALEKQDAEALAVLRNGHEIRLLELIKDIRQSQIKDAQEAVNALVKSQESAQARLDFYKNIPKEINEEKQQLALLKASGVVQLVGQSLTAASGLLTLIPDVNAGTVFFSHLTGGDKIGTALRSIGEAAIATGAYLGNEANITGIRAGYNRRWADWKLQEQLAQKDTEQIERQIISAEIRLAVAEYELRNLEKQIEQTQEVQTLMTTKFTNQQLYQWMAGQLSSTYSQCYQMAYDTAKKVEKAYQFELGVNNTSFIKFGYWDNLKKGLLAGEQLTNDLHRMELAFLDNNKRELEITKPIALSAVDPYALLKLRETGACTFRLPEILFDLDFPGHYFRRIKSVRVTIPCVTGPYTSVSATLRLTKNAIRRLTAFRDSKYEATDPDADDRFYQVTPGSQAIATSFAQNDSGIFDLNFRDDRYVPFEGAGAISEWTLELPGGSVVKDFPSGLRQFDYSTISEVVIHLSYTARDGGGDFKKQVINEQTILLKKILEDYQGIPQIISLKQQFPDAFHQLLTGHATSIVLDNKLFPAFAQGKNIVCATKSGNGGYENPALLVKCKSPQASLQASVALEFTPAGSSSASSVTIAAAGWSKIQNTSLFTNSFAWPSGATGRLLGALRISETTKPPVLLESVVEDIYLYTKYVIS